MCDCSYSCSSARETLKWIISIINFIEPYRFLIEAHVVNFYQDRLWETVDKEWMDCLRREPVDNLLLLPSGVVQDHWPISLKEFVRAVAKLSLPRRQADLQEVFPGLRVVQLNNVISQGMKEKKKHEIEILAAVINSIARRVGANTVLDIGSGQGYLAQVLSFEHELSVVAIDSSSHHGSITDARAKRIEKYYRAKKCKSRSKNISLTMPKTMTCRVLTPVMLRDVSNSFLQVVELQDSDDKPPLNQCLEKDSVHSQEGNTKPSLVLAGLHACGDLSVTMLRTFVECDEVKAVVSIGCCYNLLTEGETDEAERESAFPLSLGAKSAGLVLGKSARDLACQSAERWRGLGQVAGLHNFELHACRAAFQMVLSQYYPEVIMKSPAIGRQGKALRRQQFRRALNVKTADIGYLLHESYSSRESDPLLQKPSNSKSSDEDSKSADRYAMFFKFCNSGLDRLGLHDHQDIDFFRLWNKVEEFSEFIGPYWTLRAALGPVLETLLLLDRLLFLQEHGDDMRLNVLPLFDPVLSPRNVAIIAEKL